MNLKVTSSPHLFAKPNTAWIMRQVIIALLPTTIAAIYFFQLRAIFLILNCVLSCALTEFLITKIRKQASPIKDFSAILTGLLLALILPPSMKWYGATIGSIFAILVGKQIFGGLGANIFNPALIGRAFLMAAYPKMLTTFIKPKIVDAITCATPLSLWKFNKTLTSLKDLFFGNIAGSLGETSAICIVLGGLYLLVRKIADWRIPISIILTTVLISLVGYRINPLNGPMLFHICSGGLLLGAFFMATDPVTTPFTPKGRYTFGICCGIIIMIIRYFSGLPEGVMYSILFMNGFVPLINRYTKLKPFGTKRTKET